MRQLYREAQALRRAHYAPPPKSPEFDPGENQPSGTGGPRIRKVAQQ